VVAILRRLACSNLLLHFDRRALQAFLALINQQCSRVDSCSLQHLAALAKAGLQAFATSLTLLTHPKQGSKQPTQSLSADGTDERQAAAARFTLGLSILVAACLSKLKTVPGSSATALTAILHSDGRAGMLLVHMCPTLCAQLLSKLQDLNVAVILLQGSWTPWRPLVLLSPSRSSRNASPSRMHSLAVCHIP
jgi:hypothetical protein